MKEMLEKARNCTGEISNLSTDKKNKALKYMAQTLRDNKDLILKNNETDLINAKDKISEVMLDRLRLNESRIEAMAKGIEEVIELNDPVNIVLNEYQKDNGLLIKKVTVPFGVIAIIYESRPNVTSDVAALCLKSGNVSILRSGKEAFNTSKIIVELLKEDNNSLISVYDEENTTHSGTDETICYAKQKGVKILNINPKEI